MTPPATSEDANPYAAPKARAEQPNSLDGERPLATRISRLLAVLIDSFIPLPLMLPAIFFMESSREVSIGIIGLVGLAFFIIQVVLICKQSQTVGKALMKIRVDEYGTDHRAGPAKYLLLRIFVVGIIGGIPLVGLLFSIVNPFFIFGREQRCLHDYIAGTVVRVAP